MIGLIWKEVRWYCEIFFGEGVSVVSVSYSNCVLWVVLGWVYDVVFQDVNGELVLLFFDGVLSFSELVRCYSGDMLL